MPGSTDYIYSVLKTQRYYSCRLCAVCNKAYSVLREEGFIKLDRRRGAVIAVDADKLRAMQELTDDMRVIVANALCKNLTPEEIHTLVDEIISEYIGED